MQKSTQQNQVQVEVTHSQVQRRPKSRYRRWKRQLPQYLFMLSLIAHDFISASPVSAQFFSQGETYANQVFPTAQPITTLVIGGIRLIFIYLIGSRGLSIVSGGRGSDKVSDLAQEIVILLVAILVVDALLLLILPAI